MCIYRKVGVDVVKKTLNWTSNVALVVLLILVILVLGSKLTKSRDIFGFTPLKVLSGSMDPTIKTGDLIIVRQVDSSNIEQGDIITFTTNSDSLVTHRVIGVSSENGSYRFQTKGDANNIEDKDLVAGNQVIGKYAFRLPMVGKVSDIMTRPIGFIVLFALPILIILGKEIINYKTA